VATIASLAGIQHSSFSDVHLAPLSVPTTTLDCQVQIFPVPVKSHLSFQTGECFQRNFTLRIVDVRGREILTKILNGKDSELAIDKLSNGVYFAIFENQAGSVVKKFIKE
jgi:hypothetical protein